MSAPATAAELRDSWQRSADSITWLAIRGLLPESQTRLARKRLLRQIAECVVKPNAELTGAARRPVE